MDDHLRKQLEEILRRIDEQQTHTTEEDQGRMVHVYLLDGGGNYGGRTTKHQCTTALSPLPRRSLHLIGLCILAACIGFVFSLFPVIVTTTTTVVSATATVVTQQSILGPTGVAITMGVLALLTGLLISERKVK